MLVQNEHSRQRNKTLRLRHLEDTGNDNHSAVSSLVLSSSSSLRAFSGLHGVEEITRQPELACIGVLDSVSEASVNSWSSCSALERIANRPWKQWRLDAGDNCTRVTSQGSKHDTVGSRVHDWLFCCCQALGTIIPLAGFNF